MTRKRRNLNGYHPDLDDLDLIAADVAAEPTAWGPDPAARIDPEERLAVPGKRYFKLAPHQRLLKTHAFGRRGHGWQTRGLVLYRDPRTGRPVARDHGDLRPGEVSLVLE